MIKRVQPLVVQRLGLTTKPFSGGTRVMANRHRTRYEQHGKAGTHLHWIWTGIIQRCTNPNSKSYAHYGAKGVKICDRWRNSFQAFADDMGPRPTPKHEVDRYPNQTGDYEPGNCRWATRTQQMRNKISNRLLTFNNKTHCVAEWAEITGIKQSLIHARLRKNPDDIAGALTKPTRGMKRRLTPDEVRALRQDVASGTSLTDAGKKLGISVGRAWLVVRRKVYKYVD